MFRSIKWYPGYVIDPETLEIVGKRGKALKPYKYPKCASLRVSLYKDWKPTYVNIDDICGRMWIEWDYKELQKYFFKKAWKATRKDQLIKKFEKFYIDDAISDWILIEKDIMKGYFIINPGKENA